MLVLSAGEKINKMEKDRKFKVSEEHLKILYKAYKKDFTEKVIFDKRPGKKAGSKPRE